MNIEELKPCPFCGEKLQYSILLDDYRHPAKKKCIMNFCVVTLDSDELKLWNTRIGESRWVSDEEIKDAVDGFHDEYLISLEDPLANDYYEKIRRLCEDVRDLCCGKEGEMKSREQKAEEWGDREEASFFKHNPTGAIISQTCNDGMIADISIRAYLAGAKEAWEFLPYPKNKPENYGWYIIIEEGQRVPGWWSRQGWRDGEGDLLFDSHITAFLPIPKEE